MPDPLYRSPQHWLRTTLEPNALESIIVSVDSGGTPSTSVDEYWDGSIPWLTPKEITGNDDTMFVSRTERHITEAGLENSGAKLLSSGTVLLTKRAPVGAVAINAIPMATNQGFLNFQCGTKLRPLFLAYWFKANTRYLQQVANGSTYKELYISDLFEFEFAVPPLEEQDAVLSVMNSIQYVYLLGLPIQQSVISPEEMLVVQEQSRRLSSIRDTLVIQLLTGAIDTSKISKISNLFSSITEYAL
jgi:type I restriction enzyme S subunit